MSGLTYDQYCDLHLDFDLEFLRYCESWRFADKRANARFLPELERRAAPHLFANNVYARIAVAAAALGHVSEIPQDSSAPAFFVTLAPRRFACPLTFAGDVEFWRIQEWVERALPVFDFIGVIAAAFYGTSLPLFGPSKRNISWHVHLIVWNTSQRRLGAALKKINSKEHSLLPRAKAAKSKKNQRWRDFKGDALRDESADDGI